MSQKQAIMVGIVVVLAIAASVFVYRQYAASPSGVPTPVVQEDKKPVVASPRTIVPVERTVPSSIDDISSVIVSEAVVDTTALDAEEQGELSEIDADSESVNSLNASYDDSNF